jgi:DNA replication protein
VSADGDPSTSDGLRWTPVPDSFFSEFLPAVDDLACLKVALHLLWRVGRRAPGDPPALRLADLAQDTVLRRGLQHAAQATSGPANGSGAERPCADGEIERLERCADRLEHAGWLTIADVAGEAGPERWLWPDTPEARRHHRLWADGGVLLPRWTQARSPEPSDRGHVFTVYEENIGALTPLLAEEIEEAASQYPAGWIEDAIRVAVDNNVRKWSYVRAVLQRWARDGRGDETDQRGSEEGRERDADGPYADVVRH